jgi:hypothetical protein
MTMTEIPNMPGLSTGDGYFERGYFTGDTDFPKVRVRFTPVQTTPAVADSMNIAAAPIAVVVAMSVALVDDAGAVLHVVPGRGLVFDARSHTWQSNNTVAFDPAAWMLANVIADATDAIIWAKGLTAAAALGLLVAAPTLTPSPPAPLAEFDAAPTPAPATPPTAV